MISLDELLRKVGIRTSKKGAVIDGYESRGIEVIARCNGEKSLFELRKHSFRYGLSITDYSIALISNEPRGVPTSERHEERIHLSDSDMPPLTQE